MSNNSTTNAKGSPEMKPLGTCSVCGAGRGKQRGNQEGTVQECSECGSRWERSGGKLASQFELTECPPEPDRVHEIKPKHEWKQMEADESELEKQARKGSQNVVTGLVLVALGSLLSLTVIGAVIGVPLILIGLGAAGYGSAQGSSSKLLSPFAELPEYAPGMNPEKSIMTLENELMLFLYMGTWPISIPYLWHKRRKKQDGKSFEERVGDSEESLEEWNEQLEQSAEEWEESVEDFDKNAEMILPEIGPGMNSAKSLNSARNQTVLVLYLLTFPISIPYLLYKYRQKMSGAA